MSEAERHALQRVAKASSERVDAVKRAKALLAVAEGKTFTQAGVNAGLSRDGFSRLVERFNQRGLAVRGEGGSRPMMQRREHVWCKKCSGNLIA